MAFEETAADLTQNVASLGFDLDDLVARSLLLIDRVRVERSEIEASGDYDLEGLFIRLDHAIRSIGARCSTPSRRCSPACPTRPSCAPSCAAFSAG